MTKKYSIDFLKSDFKENIYDVFNLNFNNKPLPVDRIPNKEGVYVFTDALEGDDEPIEVLYVGKAKTLRNRIQNYKKGDDLHKRIIPIMEYLTGEDMSDYIKKKGIPFGFMVYVFLCDDSNAMEYSMIKDNNPRFNINGVQRHF